MSQPFSFSFAGDDIEGSSPEPLTMATHAAETGSVYKARPTAFPISGQALLPPLTHTLKSLIDTLPSKISYSTLNLSLDDGTYLPIPRREWWDVRVQLMAEEHESADAGLGGGDIKTGVYEGGFKSWEASVDLVRVLAARRNMGTGTARRVLEMGCGTALPSLALYKWHLDAKQEHELQGLGLSFADYNPSVLQLVTMPNILLSWAQSHFGASWEAEGELYINAELLLAFSNGLEQRNVLLSFFSGAWSADFVEMITSAWENRSFSLLILAAETIYSPMALQSFTDSVMGILDADAGEETLALIAAKKVYFGVGGSIEDFCHAVRVKGGRVKQIREESDGVRRAVVEVRKGSEHP